MATIYVNNAAGVLSAGVGPSDPQLMLMAGQGALFPAPQAGEYFWVTIVDPVTFDLEVVQCTSRSGDTLTVDRGKDGTAARAFLSGAIVEARITAGLLLELNWRAGAGSAGGVLLLGADGKVPSSFLSSDIPRLVGGKIGASVIPDEFVTDTESASAIAAAVAPKFNKSGGTITGAISIHAGQVGTQQAFINLGWAGADRRWAAAIEADGTLSLYCYDGSGGNATQVLQALAPVAGGVETQLKVGGHRVWTSAIFDPNTKLNANGGTLTNGVVNGRLYFASGAASIWFEGSEHKFSHAARGPNFIGTSDPRLKIRVGTAEPDMELGAKLELVRFMWDRENEAVAGYPAGIQQGLMADAVAKVAPQHVKAGADGYLGIDYIGLVLELALANDKRLRRIEAMLAAKNED